MEPLKALLLKINYEQNGIGYVVFTLKAYNFRKIAKCERKLQYIESLIENLKIHIMMATDDERREIKSKHHDMIMLSFDNMILMKDRLARKRWLRNLLASIGRSISILQPILRILGIHQFYLPSPPDY